MNKLEVLSPRPSIPSIIVTLLKIVASIDKPLAHRIDTVVATNSLAITDWIFDDLWCSVIRDCTWTARSCNVTCKQRAGVVQNVIFNILHWSAIDVMWYVVGYWYLPTIRYFKPTCPLIDGFQNKRRTCVAHWCIWGGFNVICRLAVLKHLSCVISVIWC